VRIRVLHPITRLIIGGAQENTMLTADFHNHRSPYPSSTLYSSAFCGKISSQRRSKIEQKERTMSLKTLTPPITVEEVADIIKRWGQTEWQRLLDLVPALREMAHSKNQVEPKGSAKNGMTTKTCSTKESLMTEHCVFSSPISNL